MGDSHQMYIPYDINRYYFSSIEFRMHMHAQKINETIFTVLTLTYLPKLAQQ